MRCIELVQQQLDTIQSNLDQLMEAKSSETKSSAGDKYETGMAMIQNQEELYKRQQVEARTRMNQLKTIDSNNVSTSIERGSLIITDLSTFYLSIALGKINVLNQDVIVLSPDSPLGKVMLGKKASQNLPFADRVYHIDNVL